MRALVVYESMFGNTRAVAEAVAEGLAGARDGVVAVARSVAEVRDAELLGLDLLVLGAPTHAWSLSRPSTRDNAAKLAAQSKGRLQLEPHAIGPGLREWLERHVATLPAGTALACFDTRVSVPMGISGSAANATARHLRRVLRPPMGAPVGFRVSKQDELVDGELARAREWGRGLALSLVPA